MQQSYMSQESHHAKFLINTYIFQFPALPIYFLFGSDEKRSLCLVLSHKSHFLPAECYEDMSLKIFALVLKSQKKFFISTYEAISNVGSISLNFLFYDVEVLQKKGFLFHVQSIQSIFQKSSSFRSKAPTPRQLREDVDVDEHMAPPSRISLLRKLKRMLTYQSTHSMQFSRMRWE